MTHVTVVINRELGWDNIVGIYPMSMYERCKEEFTGRYYTVKCEPIGGEDELDEWING